MSYVIAAPAVTALSVDGTDDRFPVHRIYCVGRNYAAHAREMGADPDREPPFFLHEAQRRYLARRRGLPLSLANLERPP